MSVKNVQEIVREMESESLRADLIIDNRIIFACDNKPHKVRMPNQLEILQAIEKKNEYEIMLLNRENTLTLKQLKKKLKEKDIDIDGMNKELIKLEDKILKVYEKLVKRHDDDKEGIEKDKKEIDVIKKEKDEVIDEISKRISPAIDIQAENYYVSYLTSVCAEKNEDDDNVKWVRVWASFDEYLKETNTDLKFFCMGYLTQLMMKS